MCNFQHLTLCCSPGIMVKLITIRLLDCNLYIYNKFGLYNHIFHIYWYNINLVYIIIYTNCAEQSSHKTWTVFDYIQLFKKYHFAHFILNKNITTAIKLDFSTRVNSVDLQKWDVTSSPEKLQDQKICFEVLIMMWWRARNSLGISIKTRSNMAIQYHWLFFPPLHFCVKSLTSWFFFFLMNENISTPFRICHIRHCDNDRGKEGQARINNNNNNDSKSSLNPSWAWVYISTKMN